MQDPETIFAIDSGDRIYYSPRVESWYKMDGGLVQMVVQKDGRIWGVNSGDDIFTRGMHGGGWQHIDGKLVNIAVGPHGEVWGANRTKGVFVRYGVGGSWKNIEGSLDQITVGMDGYVWGILNRRLSYRGGENDSWKAVDGRFLKNISAGDGILYGIDVNGFAWLFKRADTTWTQLGNIRLDQICCKPSGLVIGRYQNRIYLLEDTGNWQQLAKQALQMKCIA